VDSIDFNCPFCSNPLSVPASAASATGPCPKCGEMITGPGLPSSSVAPSPSPPKEKKSATPEPIKPATPERKKPASPASKKSAPPKSNPAPPKPEPTPSEQKAALPKPKPAPPVAKKKTGLGIRGFTALALLAIAAAFLLGYQAGQRSVVLHPSAQGSSSPPSESPGTPPPPTGTKTPILPDTNEELPISKLPISKLPDERPDTPPLPPVDEEELSPASSALTAFLSAPDWSSRLVHVLFPEKMAGQMKTLAESEGDGPIPFTQLLPTRLDHSDTEVFNVVTEQHPEGFPIAMQKVGDQWLVDWAAFAEFYHDAFRRFAQGPSGLSAVFRLQVLPHADQPDLYTLSPPTPGDVFDVQFEANSPSQEQIASHLKFYADNSPEQYELSLNEGGPHFILKLARVRKNGQELLEIQEVIGVGWAPRAPSEE
jgi:hypothetical protein